MNNTKQKQIWSPRKGQQGRQISNENCYPTLTSSSAEARGGGADLASQTCEMLSAVLATYFPAVMPNYYNPRLMHFWYDHWLLLVPQHQLLQCCRIRAPYSGDLKVLSGPRDFLRQCSACMLCPEYDLDQTSEEQVYVTLGVVKELLCLALELVKASYLINQHHRSDLFPHGTWQNQQNLKPKFSTDKAPPADPSTHETDFFEPTATFTSNKAMRFLNASSLLVNMRELSQKKPGLEDEQQCQVGDESSMPVDPLVLLCAPFHRIHKKLGEVSEDCEYLRKMKLQNEDLECRIPIAEPQTRLSHGLPNGCKLGTVTYRLLDAGQGELQLLSLFMETGKVRRLVKQTGTEENSLLSLMKMNLCYNCMNVGRIFSTIPRVIMLGVKLKHQLEPADTAEQMLELLLAQPYCCPVALCLCAFSGSQHISCGCKGKTLYKVKGDCWEVYPLCTPACAQLLQGDASLAGCRRSEEEPGPSTTPSSMMW
ncbi:hypothetical protein Anapl_00744 [Anas platyrhynchos]|uniref:Uncharacterized protein n=1 Tax=Anas platyrhynchos TaxID=8839 RepID=R0JSQ1_ANAPL|nr:hypothetical protein Anapl_00744 [Anas platyrhynchos]